MATHELGKPAFDFFICHLLSVAFAIRTLLPELPKQHAPALVKSHWLLFVIVYSVQLRPKIHPELIDAVEVGTHTWESLIIEALKKKGGKTREPHFSKSMACLFWTGGLWIADGI